MKRFDPLHAVQVPGPTPIDVRQLMRDLPQSELLAKADAYFAAMTIEAEQCRKPFSNASDAAHLTRHLGLLFDAAALFRGADVLDFGCATGWLTWGLADMGCNAVGLDVSGSALALAQQLAPRHLLMPGASASFKQYDGSELPLADASMDRIICFDAFHHVRDPAAAIKEFARVLRPGGRIAMLEPGPRHSLTEQSQYEMRTHAVIENDIRMQDIEAYARAAQLWPPRMMVQFQRPIEVPVSEFNAWSDAGALPKTDAQRVLKTLHGQLTDTQCFYISKGEPIIDSRRLESLRGELRLLGAKPVAGLSGRFKIRLLVRNTGAAQWICGEAPRLGQVNVGCQTLDEHGALVTVDFTRHPLPGPWFMPGASLELEVEMDLSAIAAPALRFDLVSEGIAWFSPLGRGVAVQLDLGKLPGKA